MTFTPVPSFFVYDQSKGRIYDIPASSVIRLVGSTLIGYFVTRELLASKMEWDDQVEVDRTVRFLMRGLA